MNRIFVNPGRKPHVCINNYCQTPLGREVARTNKYGLCMSCLARLKEWLAKCRHPEEAIRK